MRLIFLTTFIYASLLWPASYTISKVAGNDPDNVPATSIAIGSVNSLAAGPNGTFYFAPEELVLYRVSSSGIRTRVPLPQFSGDAYIFDLSVAQNGDLYIAIMSYGALIYKIPSGAGFPQLVGGGGLSRADGRALDADIGWPYFSMAAANDALYFGDGRSVRKLTPDGKVTTLQTFLTESTQRVIPLGVDAAGSVYSNVLGRILKREPGGTVLLVGGGGVDSQNENVPASSASISSFTLTVDAAGNSYFVDTGRLRTIDASTGLIRTLAGKFGEYEPTGPDGPATQVRFGYFPELSADSSGSVYFINTTSYLDAGGSRVRKLTGGVVTTVAGGGSAGDGGPAKDAHIFWPSDLAADPSGDIYIATPFYGEVRKIAAASGLISTIYRGLSGTNTFYSPEIVATGPNNTIFFGGRSKIYKLANGVVSIVAGGSTNVNAIENGMLASDIVLSLGAFAVAPNGDVYFIESFRPGLKRIGQDGRITVLSTDTFKQPVMAFEPSGNLLIGGYDGLVRFNTSTKTTTPLAYSSIYGLAADPAGNLYFANYNNVQRMDAQTLKTTVIAGFGVVPEPPDGTPAESMKFRNISGLAADHLGNVYVSDEYAHRVWRLSPRVEITTPSLAAAQMGTAYSAPVGARYGTPPYTWAVSAGSLPTGLTINSATGAIMGAPLSPGLYTFSVQVVDSVGIAAARQFTLTVAESWPRALTLSPQAASGMSQEFIATITTSPQSPVQDVQLFIGASLASPNQGCMVRYNSGAFSMVSADATSWVSPANNVLSNGRCALSLRASTAATVNTGAGLSTTIKFSIEAANGFAGTQKIFLYATGLGGTSNGWTERGIWNIQIPARSEPYVVSLSPLNGNGQTQTFTGAFQHTAGPSQLYLAYILLLPTPNIVQYTAAGSCLVEYNRISHAMRLINEAGDNWLGPLPGVPLSQGGSLTNSRCTLNIGASSAQIVGSSLVVNASLTLSPNFTGTLGTFLQSQDVNGIWTGMTQFGNWVGAPRSTPKPGPFIVSMTPSNATGSATYTLTVGHTSGISQLGVVHLRFNSSIVNGAPCHVVYFPGSNTMNLVNDAGTGFELSAAIALGSVTVGTGRCIVDAGASRTTSGNLLTLTLPMRFINSNFAGVKTAYANAFDIYGNLTHWVNVGTLTVP